MRVVNIRNLEDLGDNEIELIIYVGRNVTLRGIAGDQSLPILKNLWTHNPRLTKNPKFLCETREEAITKYAQWLERMIFLHENDEVLKALRSLREDSILGCWCKPKACHADEIVRLWKKAKDEGLI